jgi:trk system potassium uptake protein TrkA
LKDILYAALVGDATDSHALEELGLDQVDTVVISLGEDLARSLLATLHAKECGAKRIVVKAISQDHMKLLSNMGVSRVIFPETDIAVQLADQLTWTNVLDVLAIDSEFSFMETAVPTSMIGQSLQEADIRRRFGVWVVGLRDALTQKLRIFCYWAKRLIWKSFAIWSRPRAWRGRTREISGDVAMRSPAQQGT